MNNIFYKIFNIADADGRFLDATLPIAFYLMDIHQTNKYNDVGIIYLYPRMNKAR